MKTLLAVTLSLFFVSSTGVQAQTSPSTTKTPQGASTPSTRKRGPIFRANKEQINQAQTILKGRGFYPGEQTGKLDEPTRNGLRKYQESEGLKMTGTLNKITLEKMGVELTDKQKAM